MTTEECRVWTASRGDRGPYRLKSVSSVVTLPALACCLLTVRPTTTARTLVIRHFGSTRSSISVPSVLCGSQYVSLSLLNPSPPFWPTPHPHPHPGYPPFLVSLFLPLPHCWSPALCRSPVCPPPSRLYTPFFAFTHPSLPIPFYPFCPSGAMGGCLARQGPFGLPPSPQLVLERLFTFYFPWPVTLFCGLWLDSIRFGKL